MSTTVDRSPEPVPRSTAAASAPDRRGALDIPPGLLLPGHMRFIDGLRALAVGVVILYHMNPLFLSGGYIGVDVFFVISGFVITKSLLYDHAHDRGSVVRFLGSRIKRIVPAVLFMAMIVICETYLLYTAREQTQFLGQHPWSALVQVSNIAFAYDELAYTDVAEFKNPLLHTWSLGVESQFYLLFPIIIVIAFRWIRQLRVLTGLLVALVGVSLALYVVPRQDM